MLPIEVIIVNITKTTSACYYSDWGLGNYEGLISWHCFSIERGHNFADTNLTAHLEWKTSVRTPNRKLLENWCAEICIHWIIINWRLFVLFIPHWHHVERNVVGRRFVGFKNSLDRYHVYQVHFLQISAWFLVFTTLLHTCSSTSWLSHPEKLGQFRQLIHKHLISELSCK